MGNTLTQLTIFGGVSQNPQVDALRNGVDILIATQEDY
jgi:ATP-dependent RNA helicase RhlE